MERHREAFRHLRRRPGMYVRSPVAYDIVVAYITGYDHDSDDGVLDGWREWIAGRYGE